MSWNPFNDDASTWFDPKWMFGVDKFDIVIGNPPYINIKNQSEYTRNLLKEDFKFSRGADIYVAFLEIAFESKFSHGPVV